jgi:hypothetical protein
MEAGVFALNQLRIRHRMREGNRRAPRVARFTWKTGTFSDVYKSAIRWRIWPRYGGWLDEAFHD